MNILFVHEIDWLRKVIFEPHTLAELLSLQGHKVFAIDYESMWVKKSPFDFGSLRTKVVPKVARAYPEASVCLRSPGFIKIPGLSRLSAGLTSYREIQRTIKQEHIDVIVLYAVPTTGWQTIRLGKSLGIPVVFRSIDVSHQLVRQKALRPVTRMLEKRVYSHADLLLTLSPMLSQYVIRLGAPEKKVELLPLGVDTAMFRPGIDGSEVGRRWGVKPGDPLVVFIGSLFDFSGMDGFIRRFPEVLQAVPEAKLLIVGDGPQRPKLENIIAELGLRQQVVITGFQPYADMPPWINLATVCINTFAVTPATRDIFPTKVIQYMACARPVVSAPLPGMMALAAGEGQGVVYSGADSMARDVVEILKSAERAARLGQAGLRYVTETHGYGRIAQRLEARLAELIHERRSH